MAAMNANQNNSKLANNAASNEDICTVAMEKGENSVSTTETRVSTTTDIPWAELDCKGKLWRVTWLFARLCLVLCMLYLFICSLDVLQGAFQMLAGRAAGQVFQQSDLLNNPVCGLIIGILVTVLVQSSSTSTSIIITMVASQLLSVKQSIPIIMGSNIGTSVTNTIVSMTQSSEKAVFRRSFAGATVHDMFNWSCVIILLPIEAISGFMYYMTKEIVKPMGTSSSADNPVFLQVITKPMTNEIIQIDKNVIYAIAENSDRQKYPIAKYYCESISAPGQVCFNSQGSHLFTGVGVGSGMDEILAGAILLICSLFFMIICLLIMVKLLNSLLQGSMAKIIHKFINSDFPGYAKHLTGYVAILIGAGMTMLVQSSSVFTSALTPLVGINILTIERMYPLTLGANIGTTITGILTALTADADRFQDSIQLAFCHSFFNVIGILIFYPIPLLRRWPIFLAKKLGAITENYRWFAGMYDVCFSYFPESFLDFQSPEFGFLWALGFQFSWL
ncbi:hypothetical protein CAPTEDRAFT_210511 [Capitella teleta]|uniref:Uncharacterized protein n=1 Tax=Capitella teleta TaxID=283909 RepID=R7VL18_CAPTE|nr:hypothetical protein CAPTEDRAFT_210511 [Capitella teleta]|eukprot:ELU17220.1 hypothetical protein CAPTEDRAFT_210511 [Capitella teleta]